MTKAIISVKEASQISGLSVNRIRTLVQDGAIPGAVMTVSESGRRCTFTIPRAKFMAWLGVKE